MKNVRVARRYAAALMAVAEELHSVQSIDADLNLIERTVKASRELRLLIASPVVSPARKQGVIHALFDGKVGVATMSFLELLIGKQRESHIPGIVEQYRALRDDRLGIVSVEVTAAVALTPEQEKELAAGLERTMGKQVRLHIRVEGGIRGGLVLRVGDTVRDASVRRQLEILRERFRTGGN
ncbi:MAG: ATP synthase F1 subunit delta [Bacteroidota bacterium]